jgi:hypothetical protein
MISYRLTFCRWRGNIWCLPWIDAVEKGKNELDRNFSLCVGRSRYFVIQRLIEDLRRRPVGNHTNHCVRLYNFRVSAPAPPENFVHLEKSAFSTGSVSRYQIALSATCPFVTQLLT